MWHLTACKISVSLSCLNWSKIKLIFYSISELMLPTLIEGQEKNSFYFWPISKTRDWLKFYRLSDATFLAHLSWKLKVSFCDHSLSVVVFVRMSVRPSTIFKQHLLLNHWLDFDQTSQEWSLVGPLSKLFKWFWSVAYLGHRSLK